MSRGELVILIVCTVVGGIILILFCVLLYKRMKSEKKPMTTTSVPEMDQITTDILASIDDKKPRYDLIMQKLMTNTPSNFNDLSNIKNIGTNIRDELENIRKDTSASYEETMCDKTKCINMDGLQFKQQENGAFMSDSTFTIDNYVISMNSCLLKNSYYRPIWFFICTPQDSVLFDQHYLLFENKIKWNFSDVYSYMLQAGLCYTSSQLSALR